MFRTIFTEEALSHTKNIDKKILERIITKINYLAKNADNMQHTLLSGNLTGFYKLKVGAWRIVYGLDRENMNIFIHRIGHRREVYR
ncbi:RelE/StbE family addiction module toxin [Candidatus Magnetoovum chiemensis]|nr:RelE/StbE family addiction module toxin [Candidatus Magnetoovum chiemensis]